MPQWKRSTESSGRTVKYGLYVLLSKRSETMKATRTRLVGATQDITDVRRAQQQDISRQKLESLGVLAGGVAHDFNNLLGSIVTNAELVLSELPDGSPASEGVESIRNVAGRAAEIVGQMMAYAGQEDTVFEPVDLSELLHEMLEFLKVSISKRATLERHSPRETPRRPS